MIRKYMSQKTSLPYNLDDLQVLASIGRVGNLWKTMFRLEEMETKVVKPKGQKTVVKFAVFITSSSMNKIRILKKISPRYHQGKSASRNGGDKKAARGDGQHDIIYLKKKRKKQ